MGAALFLKLRGCAIVMLVRLFLLALCGTSCIGKGKLILRFQWISLKCLGMFAGTTFF